MVFDVMFLWIIVAVTLFIMVASILACLCGCCARSPRDELMGLSGMVKLTNPDTLHNNNTPLALSIIRTPSDDNVPNTNLSLNASVKRSNNIGSSTGGCGGATRSLPEIPVDASSVVPNGNAINSGNFTVYSTGDTNSDLYATLEEHKITTSASPIKQKFGSSSHSNGTVMYEQIDENAPYNKIKEHPYAQVDEVDGMIASTSRHDRDSTDGMEVSSDENMVDIPAASAITGNIAASNELPYMTPPLHNNHFSGDSQDSSKGYTSITVREPIACIRPQTKINQDTTDSHYTVLSDDSDEMYAAIQDAYTSGSETYAQIQPVASTSSFIPPQNNQNNKRGSTASQSYSNNSVHSRQASTSSVCSSLANRNSPKEKRQANSPLPKPPDILPDDMYAKVLKKKKYESERYPSRDSMFSEEQASSSNLGQYPGTLNLDQHSNMDENNDRQGDNNNDVDEIDGIGQSSRCYETLPERNYEILPDANPSLGYETVKEPYQNPGYESLPEPDSLTPGYERIREPSLGYEKVRYATMEEEISEPNYEELKPQKDTESTFHCYATIEKKNPTNSGSVPEPDYASLTRHHQTEYDSWNNRDPFYEIIQKKSDNEDDDIDSNYDKIGNKVENKPNDKNNNHTDSGAKSERLTVNHSIPENDLSELYSKVNKTKR